MLDEFHLFNKVRDLHIWFEKKMVNWTKSDRLEYGICYNLRKYFSEIEYKLIEHNYNSAKRSSQYRSNILYEASTNLDMLKVTVDSLRDLKVGCDNKSKSYYLSKSQHEYAVECLNEIGRMLGSYIKNNDNYK
jgi:hypothetical protein